MSPLQPIAARPVSWWVANRERSRHLLSGQIGRSGEFHVLPSTHREILREPALLGSVAALLVPAFEVA